MEKIIIVVVLGVVLVAVAQMSGGSYIALLAVAATYEAVFAK